MDFCRNVSVSGGLPSEYKPEQVLSPCSKLGALDDLFSGHCTEEGDVNLEWLSIFVEDCLSGGSGGNCLPPGPIVPPKPNNVQNTSSKRGGSILKPSKPLQVKTQTQHQTRPADTHSPLLDKFLIPGTGIGKARSKRKRGRPMVKAKTNPLTSTSWSHHLNPPDQTLQITTSPDPLLLQQTYWLADSELILPKKEEEEEEEEENSISNCREIRDDEEKEEETQEDLNNTMMMGGKKDRLEGSLGQPRRCSHCLAQRTPQWRGGPLGPKTLCNACGVRYKSGRLLPEYRPAKSPTFVSFKHSNSHKKVMEMRMMALP